MEEQQRRLIEELLFTGEHKPSFAKMLYFGIFDSEKVFPYYEVSPEEKEGVETLIQNLKDFCDKNIDGDWIDRHTEIPDSVIKGLGKLGVLGITIPKEFNGLGMSQYAYCRAVECVSRYCGATALFINAHQSIGLKALLLFGKEEQKKYWLPRLSQGENLAAFSLTEPNAGSDASAIETRAIYDADKKVYRINGRKQWTTNGGIAQILTVMARTEIDTSKGKQDKITAFLVTPDMPGFKVLNPALEKVGMRGSKTANLQFENMEVPEENILGPLGGGLKVCLTVLDYGRTTFGAACTGAAKFSLAKAIQHANSRIQFKRPLSSFPLVKKKIATMAALVYAMDATTYMTAGLVDLDKADFMIESAILKVFASESLWYVLYETMQIYGGRSFFTTEPLERMMRDARLNMIGEGSNEVLRAFIGVVGMRDVGMQLKSLSEAASNPWDNFGVLSKFLKQFIGRLQVPVIPVESSLFSDEAKRLGKGVRRLGIAVIKLLSKYREEVVEKQLLLDRVATAMIAIYTTTAVLSKIDAEIRHSRPDSKVVEEHIAVAKFYCKYAMDLFDDSMDSLFKNDDEEVERVSRLITGQNLSSTS